MSANVNYDLIRMIMDFQYYEVIFAEYQRLVNHQNDELESCHNTIAALQEIVIRQHRLIERLRADINDEIDRIDV